MRDTICTDPSCRNAPQVRLLIVVAATGGHPSAGVAGFATGTVFAPDPAASAEKSTTGAGSAEFALATDPDSDTIGPLVADEIAGPSDVATGGSAAEVIRQVIRGEWEVRPMAPSGGHFRWASAQFTQLGEPVHVPPVGAAA